MDPDQPGTTTKPKKMVIIAYVPCLSRNLLSTREAVDRWGKLFLYFKTKAVLRFSGEESLVFNFCPRKGLFSTTGVRRTPRQGAALALVAKMTEAIRITTTGKWGFCELRLQAEGKQKTVQWIDGPYKTVSNGVRNENRGVKPGKYETVGRREAPQLDV